MKRKDNNLVLSVSNESSMLSLTGLQIFKTVIYREDLQELWQLIALPSNLITSWKTLSTNKVYNWTANTVYKNTPFIIKDNLILIPKTDPLTSGAIFNEAEHIRYKSLTGSIAELSYNAPVETGFGALFLRPATGDGNDIYTKLLMHFNNGNTIKDSSEAGKISIARNGAISTVDNIAFGGYSLELNGTNQDLLLSGGTNPGQLGTDLNIANGSPITIDTFITPTSLTGTRPIFCGAQNATNYFVLQTVGNLLQFVLQSGGGGIEITLNSNDVLTLNTRTHVAVVSSYAGNVATYRLFINGVLQTGAPTTNNSQITIGTGSMTIGSDLSRGGTAFFAGRIDELRFSRVNRYNTTNFTPNTKEYGLGFYLLLASGLLVELGSVGGNSSSNNSQSAIANTVAQRTNNAGLVASAFVPNVVIIPNQTANYEIPQAILDTADIIEIDQTTAGILFTLATPTDNQRKITIRASSIATASFDVLSTGNTIQNIGSQRSKNLVYTSTSSWTDATGGSQNIYTVTSTANQTLLAGYTGIYVPSTVTIDVVLTPQVGAYTSGSAPIPVINDSTTNKITVAGLNVILPKNASLLTPNSTDIWYPLNDPRYKIITHTLGSSVIRLKSLKKLPSGFVLGNHTDNGSDLITNRQSNLVLVIETINSTQALVFDGSGKIQLPYAISSIYPNLTSANISTVDGELYLNDTGDLVRSDLKPTDGNAVIIAEFINDNELHYTQQLIPIIPNVAPPVIEQVEGNKKQYVLTGGKITNGVNDIISIGITNITDDSLVFDTIASPMQGKFGGATQTLLSSVSLIKKLATEIPVFGGTVVNPNLDSLVNNINTNGANDYILAINSALTIFAIPSPVANPNLNFIDTIGDITTLTAGQIGFQLNPLKPYRHNGIAIETYDFILLGQLTWNGSVFSNVINFAFNRKARIEWTTFTANTPQNIPVNIGTKLVKSLALYRKDAVTNGGNSVEMSSGQADSGGNLYGANFGMLDMNTFRVCPAPVFVSPLSVATVPAGANNQTTGQYFFELEATY